MTTRRLLPLLLLLPLLGGCLNRAERLYQRAEMFFMQGQPELAAMEYYRLATKQPRSDLADDALYKLGYLYREEFDNPQNAIVTYELLATGYPASPYADEAWMWILQIQAQQLRDCNGVRRTCAIIHERFSSDQRLCASAQLQLVKSLFAAGQLAAADMEARTLLSNYSDQSRQCAAALLVRARIMEKRGGRNSDAAVKFYEQIVNKYPQTAAAVQAKQSIGWLFYGYRNTHIKQERLAQQRASRMLANVPPPPGTSRRLQVFACLVSLLGHRGIEVSPEELLVLSGGAMQPVYGAGAGNLPRNALSAAAEAYGLSANVWSAPSAESSFASLTQAIAAGRPVMVPLNGGGWWVVSGYQAAEDRVQVLEPGERQPKALPRSQFIARWARRAASRCATGPYFQFSVEASSGQASPSERLSAIGRSAAESRERVLQSYAALLEAVSESSRASDPAATQRLQSWAQHDLPEVLGDRQALARYLSAGADGAAGACEEVVRAGRNVAEAFHALTPPAEGATATAETTWSEALEAVRQMRDAEEQALRQLVALSR